MDSASRNSRIISPHQLYECANGRYSISTHSGASVVDSGFLQKRIYAKPVFSTPIEICLRNVYMDLIMERDSPLWECSLHIPLKEASVIGTTERRAAICNVFPRQ